MNLHMTNIDYESQSVYSHMWEWYIHHLSTGSFEDINNNKSLSRLLDKFILQYNSSQFNSTSLIFVLSLKKFQNDDNYLKNLLKNYYNEEFIDVEVTPIGAIKSEEILIMVKDSEKFSTKNIQQRYCANTETNEEEEEEENGDDDVNSVYSGEPGYIPSVYTQQSISQDSLPDSIRSSLSYTSTYSESFIEDNGGVGAVLTRVSTIQNNSMESESIHSVTDQTSQSIISTTKSFLLPAVPQFITDNDETLINLSIIIFKNLTDNLKKVAIRQISENNEFIDDWILYDDEFCFSNLQLLSLNEVLELTSNYSRILIYSNLSFDDVHSDNESLDSNIDENDLSVHEFDGGELGKSNSSITDSENETIRVFNSRSGTSILTQPTTVELSHTTTSGKALASIKSKINLNRKKSTQSFSNGLSKSKSSTSYNNSVFKKKIGFKGRRQSIKSLDDYKTDTSNEKCVIV
ncbi:hypothetical protein WICMUC_003876 [Wickerhamomyces mucosus]|uniref:Uncharacterized protein n=1 Tax=Wickerhamomyces mucosus TaxID=1378264 RepID=A0A9P8PKD4_9ASCO|nr:hypothetical protein WICMUC_003876 [Wickerhamomyces mucosus]